MADHIQLPALRLTGLCNRISIVADNQPQAAYILVELRPEAATTLPTNLAVVVDSGRQVGGQAWDVVKSALHQLVDSLQPQDRLAVINAGIPPQVVVASQPVEDRAQIQVAISELAVTGMGSLTASMDEAVRQLQSANTPDRSAQLLLVLSRPYTDEWDSVCYAARQARMQGIHIQGVGVGNEWSESLVYSLLNQEPPDATPGLPVQTLYAPEPGALNGMMSFAARSVRVAARQMHLSAWFARNVRPRQVWQVRPLIADLGTQFIQPSAISMPIAALDNNGISFLVDLELPARAIGPVRIARLQICYQDQDAQEQKAELDLVVTYSQDTSMTNPLDNYVMDHVERMQAFDLRLQALSDLDAGNVQAATQKLRQATAILASQGNTTLADRIRGEVDVNLRQYGQISTEGRKYIALMGRQPAETSTGGL